MKSSVAVVIPYRGDLIYLREAVNSVRESSWTEFRILVFDDNSEPQVLDDFLNDDEYFPTGGIGLPAVIEYSKQFIFEDYVAILAGDDLMSPNRLQLQLKAIEQESSEVCLSRMQKFSLNHDKIEMLSGSPEIETFTKVWLLLGAYGADGTILMTTDFYDKKYVLDPIDSYSDWSLALANYPSQIAYIPEDLVFYRQHEGQTTRKNRNDFLQSGVFPAWQKTFKELLGSSPTQDILLILGAPWFRCAISPRSILKSRIFAAQILASFHDQMYTRVDRESVELLILRRYLFRLSLRNLAPILYVLYRLDIRQANRRMLREALKIAKSLIFQRDVRPRFIDA
jgi:glycosyltransferase involved in cell wall biosynthesis